MPGGKPSKRRWIENRDRKRAGEMVEIVRNNGGGLKDLVFKATSVALGVVIPVVVSYLFWLF